MSTEQTSPRDSALREIDRYYSAHPQSPSAVWHPRIVVDGHRYVALLGSSRQGGVFGFGSTISAALRCFDDLYTKCNRTLA